MLGALRRSFYRRRSNVRSLLNQGVVHARVWHRKYKSPFPGFSGYFCSFEGSTAISKPAPNPGTHQTLVETLSDKQQTGFYPYPLGAWSARPNPKRARQRQKTLYAQGLQRSEGDRDHGLRPWSRKGPDHGVGVDPSLLQ